MTDVLLYSIDQIANLIRNRETFSYRSDRSHVCPHKSAENTIECFNPIVLEEKKAQLAGQVVIGILSNHDQGKLQGVPVAIKDIIGLVRTPATCSLITFRMLPL
ncbi:TPA: hypothetical protein EYN65_23565 [Candidatus Poribacteria bacterium]|nr:hypothetical protein [Candidatus Poribacteria bacterium]HIO48991.1 hypothetical protein [Candidatus Poribacteria bacterium]